MPHQRMLGGDATWKGLCLANNASGRVSLDQGPSRHIGALRFSLPLPTCGTAQAVALQRKASKERKQANRAKNEVTQNVSDCNPLGHASCRQGLCLHHAAPAALCVPCGQAHVQVSIA